MSTIKTETLSTPSNATVPVDTVVNGTAKAWVNFNGTGTVAIRRAFNVSSITDLEAGQYKVNFTTAMPYEDYAVVVTGTAGQTSGGKTGVDTQQGQGNGINLGAYTFFVIRAMDGATGSAADSPWVNAAVFI